MNPAHGGPCQGIRNTIPALQRLGIENEVICLDDPAAPFLKNDPFRIHALGESKGPWAWNQKLLNWLVSNLSNYDAVIVHGIWQYHNYAVAKAMRKLSKIKLGALPKVYIMPHGMLDPWFQQHQSRRMKALRNWGYWKILQERVIREAEGVLFTCRKELELARTSFSPYQPKKELNVGYGVPMPPVFTPAMEQDFRSTCPALGGQPYLLFLSRIHPKKGVDLLLQAFARLAKDAKVGKPLPHLVIAGPGLDTAYGRQMQQLAKENPALQDCVHFPGMLTGEAKWGALYGCDAFVLPSHQENFGIAVVEALACRKPVLISNQVNIFHEIEAAGAGIVAADTVEGVERQLQTWLELEAGEKVRMQQRAWEAYQQHFTVEAAARQMMAALL